MDGQRRFGGNTSARLARSALTVTALLGAAACGPAQPPYKPVADVKQLMQAVVAPSADGVWKSVGTIYTMNGVEERRPRTAKEWDAVRTHAMTLAEAGNLLMMPTRAKDGGEWMTFAQQFVDASAAALRAAEARDAERLMDAGGPIDEVCERCHKKYWPDY